MAFKSSFCNYINIQPFRLANLNQTTTKEFIHYILVFYFQFDILFHDEWTNLKEDITYFLYLLCIKYRKSSITC